MTLSVQQSLIIIAVVSLGTIITRGLPFILFRNQDTTPPYIVYLGKVLPFAAIGLLIIYCLRNVSLLSAPYGLPEAIAILFVTVLHLWKNNALLSIGGGTVLYMLLVQTVFG
ncbi:MAG: branched-chain amino acid transporter AzlD [Syntrophomonadaceae bacterium]|nr:branched-chain amino acid transporter AzlD [Syntrophomonadaceae bacterium]